MTFSDIFEWNLSPSTSRKTQNSSTSEVENSVRLSNIKNASREAVKSILINFLKLHLDAFAKQEFYYEYSEKDISVVKGSCAVTVPKDKLLTLEQIDDEFVRFRDLVELIENVFKKTIASSSHSIDFLQELFEDIKNELLPSRPVAIDPEN
jgi:hypothetical protein